MVFQAHLDKLVQSFQNKKHKETPGAIIMHLLAGLVLAAALCKIKAITGAAFQTMALRTLVAGEELAGFRLRSR